MVQAIDAMRNTDPTAVESALTDLGGRRRWLAPLVYVAGTVAVVFDGVLLLSRNWRLTLLQLFPAMWIWGMSYNIRHHALSAKTAPNVAIAAAVGVLFAAQLAYWCNATFAFTLREGATGDIKTAFREARPHWPVIGGLALATGAAQAVIWLEVPRLHTHWLSLAYLLMFFVQIYLFVAIPCWLLGVRKSGTRGERLLEPRRRAFSAAWRPHRDSCSTASAGCCSEPDPSASSEACCSRSVPSCTRPQAPPRGSSRCPSASGRRQTRQAPLLRRGSTMSSGAAPVVDPAASPSAVRQ